MDDIEGTTVKLREHLEKRMCEMEKRFKLQFESMQSAIGVTTKENDRRMTEMNELRKEVVADRGQFVKKEVYDIWHTEVDRRLTTSETRAITWTAAIGLFFVIVSIVLKFIK